MARLAMPPGQMAPALEIKTAGGANKSDTTVTVKAVHTDDRLYFLLTWADPTQSFLRIPWEKQADGSRKYVTDPNDKGGDNNTTYEDKISLIWNIDDSIQGFDQSGCFTTYHFALATFDSTQVRHAFQAGVTPFVFQQ